MTEEYIKKLCERYNIENYTINDDMSIDVDGNVNLFNGLLTQLPLKFNKVIGTFACGTNELTTLRGCPVYVGKSFCCDDNELSSLEYCPAYVKEDFWFGNNPIKTLQHLPVNFHVGGSFYSNEIDITEAKEFGKILFGYVGGEIQTDFGYLNLFLNENKNPPKKDLPRLLSELRKIPL